VTVTNIFLPALKYPPLRRLTQNPPFARLSATQRIDIIDRVPLTKGTTGPILTLHRDGLGGEPAMIEDEKGAASAATMPQPANDNGGVAAALDPRILTIARAIGRLMARERFAAVNDNRPPQERGRT
jgi:hypothetical protein